VLTEDEEVILLLKTHRDKLPALEAFFEAEHPYEVPEFLVFEADKVGEKYAKWMREELRMEGK
jgi:periplasmic divalent cation tolerance protein